MKLLTTLLPLVALVFPVFVLAQMDLPRSRTRREHESLAAPYHEQSYPNRGYTEHPGSYPVQRYDGSGQGRGEEQGYRDAPSQGQGYRDGRAYPDKPTQEYPNEPDYRNERAPVKQVPVQGYNREREQEKEVDGGRGEYETGGRVKPRIGIPIRGGLPVGGGHSGSDRAGGRRGPLHEPEVDEGFDGGLGGPSRLFDEEKERVDGERYEKYEGKRYEDHQRDEGRRYEGPGYIPHAPEYGSDSPKGKGKEEEDEQIFRILPVGKAFNVKGLEDVPVGKDKGEDKEHEGDLERRSILIRGIRL